MKGIIKFIIAIILVCAAGYLIYDLASENLAQKKDVQSFCTIKCNYNPTSFYWEFSADNGKKGFTTEDECFNYCSKVRMGFAYVLKEYGTAFLSSFGGIFKER